MTCNIRHAVTQLRSATIGCEAAVALTKHIFDKWLAMFLDTLGEEREIAQTFMGKLGGLMGLAVCPALKDFFTRVLQPMCWWSAHWESVMAFCVGDALTIAHKDLAVSLLKMCDSFSDFKEAASSKEGCYSIFDGEDVVVKLLGIADYLSKKVQPVADSFLQAQLADPMKKAMDMLASVDAYFEFMSNTPGADLKDVVARGHAVVAKLADLAEIGEIIEKAVVGQIAVNRAQYIFRRCRGLRGLATLMTLMSDSGTGPEALQQFHTAASPFKFKAPVHTQMRTKIYKSVHCWRGPGA